MSNGCLRGRISAAVALAVFAAAAQADFYLVNRIDLSADFGPLGNNPVCLTADEAGAFAYVGGYTAVDHTLPDGPGNIGILKVNLTNPLDRVALTDGSQPAQQFRFYQGLVARNGKVYALVDRPMATDNSTNLRAIDATTGLFDAGFGIGGVITAPVGARSARGMAFDPGFEGGGESGLALIASGSGRRVLYDPADGFLLRDTADGMIVADIAGCATTIPGAIVPDLTAWRDLTFDPAGNVFLRRSNQVQRSARSGANSIGGNAHLTDALASDTSVSPPPGSDILDCGNGRPIALRLRLESLGQNVEFVPAASAGADEDIVIFNDRPNNAPGLSFNDSIRITTATGDLPATAVNLLRGNGAPLTTAEVPNGVCVYDFYYAAATDTLLVLDFSARRLLVFSPVQPATGACCLPDGSCTIEAQADCTGTYQGDDTGCEPNPCPQPTGACCTPGGACMVITAADCVEFGVYQGDGTACEPNPCPVTGCRGDSNCDTAVNFDDIDCFVAALIGQAAWDSCGHLLGCDYTANNDVDGNAAVNFDDIDPFIVALISGACAP